MKVYQYPVVKFPFHAIIGIGNQMTERGSLCYPRDLLEQLYNAFITDPLFLELYPKFFKYISAFFENSGLTAFDVPGLRFHQHKAIHLSPSAFPPRKIVIVPLTPLFGANSFCYESQPGLEDWNVINGKIGDFIVHDGAFKDNFENNSGVHSLAMTIGFYREQQ